MALKPVTIVLRVINQAQEYSNAQLLREQSDALAALKSAHAKVFYTGLANLHLIQRH